MAQKIQLVLLDGGEVRWETCVAFWGGNANGGWFGVPLDSDLPSQFKIDYIRAWTKAV